ncbi:non-ribosomal peptide synthetase [Streptomyces viridochromogenes]|uniref:non-ribosomal peptide synthetase n=1 Tax=Streptomyces viridochromogenes TaxID=1938 RepID=UPI000A46A787|nr:non-ribosomal peptide synthetase [Streptomyces viridochromogenes]
MSTDVFSALSTLSPEQQRLLRERLGGPAADAAASGAGPGAALIARQRPERIPLSFAQQRLWFLNRFEEQDLGHNQIFAVRLSGPLDPSALEAALGDLVERHEILRTVYPELEGLPRQQILDAARSRPRLEVHSIVGADETGLRQAMAEANLPFDLTVDPPLRARLFVLGPTEHVFHLLLHHVATDWLSNGTLRSDLWTAFAARLSGRRPQWAPLALQYADYALWQRARLSEEEPDSLLARQLAYWTRALAGAPAELRLPSDRSWSATTGTGGESHQVRFDARLHDRLAALARRNDATLFMVLHAAVAALLTRLGAGTDIPLSSPIADRSEAALDGVVGFFVNTLVLRAETAGAPSFRELLDRVRRTALAAYAHQDIPFERVVDAINPERVSGRHPFTQVSISLEGTTAAVDDLPGLCVQQVPTTTGSINFDLLFSFVEHHDEDGGPAGLDLEVGYKSGLFEPYTIQAMTRRLVRLLTAVAADCEQSITDIELSTAEERHQVLTAWQGPEAPVPDVSVPALFRAQATRTPDAIALSDAHQSWTYAQLDTWSDQIAHSLTGQGIQAEDRIGLLMERSPATVAALMAVLKTGAAYLPLRSTDPADRIHHIVLQANPRIILVDSTVTHLTGTLPARVHTLDGRSADGTDAPSAALPDPHPDQLACVMYASGATEPTRGIAATHRNITDFATDHRWTNGTHQCVLFHSPLAFDISTYELWVPLLAGSRVHVAAPGELALPTLMRTLKDGAVTAAWLSAELFQQLTDLDPTVLNGLHEVWTGGDVFAATVRRFHEHCPDTTVVNGYGPTETTTFATSHSVSPPDASGTERTRVAIGTPLVNMRSYVLDERLRPCPPGVPGELYLSGEGLARGYLQQPGLTAERFVAHPFGDPGERMYRSGDLARWTPDGRLDFLGHADGQTVIRGFHVEPGEVQHTIATHPAIRQCYVTIHEDGADDKRLIAYLVPEDPQHFSPDRLRKDLSNRLPGPMMPSAFLTLDALPHGGNGEIDREALPAPERAGPHSSPGDQARTAVERRLCALFAKILVISDVHPREDFFAAGGNSLLILRLCAQIRKEFGCDLTAREVYDHPTPQALATLLYDGESPALHRPPLRPGAAAGQAPLLAPVQRGLWFLHQLDGYRSAYNVPLAVQLTGPLDHTALAQALNDVVSRHDALRTLIPDDDGEPTPRTLPVEELPQLLTVVTATDEDLPGLLERESAREFDIEAELPVRSCLFRISGTNGTRHVLSLVIHHLAIDGWSMDILWQELATSYQARANGQVPDWPALHLSYADYARWHHTLLGTPEAPTIFARHQLDHWRRTLRDLPAEILLPYDHPRPEGASLTFRELILGWEPEVLDQLEALAARSGTSLLTVAQAAVAALLTRLGAGSDIPLGTPVAGRLDEGLGEVLGHFVNTVTLRVDTSGDPSIPELIARTRESALSAYAHQDIPFDRLVMELRPPRQANRNPLFQTDVTCVRADTELPRFGDISAEALPTSSASAKFDLAFAFVDDREGPSGGLQCHLSYCTELFDPATAQRIRSELDGVVREFATAATARTATAAGLAQQHTGSIAGQRHTSR